MTTNSGIMLALNQILVRLLLPFPHFIVLLFPSYPEESVYAKWSVVIGGLNSVLVDRPLTKTYDKQKWIPGSKMVQHSCRVAHWVHWRKKVFRLQTFWAHGPKTLSGWRPQRCSDFLTSMNSQQSHQVRPWSLHQQKDIATAREIAQAKVSAKSWQIKNMPSQKWLMPPKCCCI